jgi:PKD repeat protein
VSSAIIGTQGFYALSIAANPLTANEITVGGLDVWKCTNVPNSGTASFTQISYWSSGSPYVHADIHELEYNGATLYSACDGGLFVSANGGTSWSDKSNGLQISEMYGFGQSATNANLLLQGWQDNGTNLLNGTSWSRVISGDGMKAFISRGSDQNQWGSLYYGMLQRSVNGGASFSSCTSGISEFVGSSGPGPWVTEFNEDLTTPNTIYCGFANVWKSTDGGSSWNKLGTISTSTVYVQAIAAAPTTNGQVILAAKGGILYRTTNGGTAWTAVTSLPNATISDIAFHPANPSKAWVTYSGFSNVNKVFQTSDQGVTWTNISASIPNIPVNCITVDKNGNDALYIGTDAGVFYKDASSIIWQPFFNGLPNVTVTQLEIFYSGSKIRASTYGRGMWESTLYAGPYSPDANFVGNVLIGCPGLGVQFSDYSAGSPTSWNWTFQGGNPPTSSVQNPFVSYNIPGTYSVSLTVNNTVGPANSETLNGYINISSGQQSPTASSYTICGPQSVTLTATPAVSTPGTIRWWNQPGGGNILASGNTYAATLSGTQTFYVDEAFPSGQDDYVGQKTLNEFSGTGGLFTANDIRGLYFDVFKPAKIKSVDVYSATTGTRTIEILDENGNLITDTTLVIAASGTVTPTTVTINRTVYPGKNYFMKFRGDVDAYRNNAATPFPLVDGGSGCITITETNAGSPGFYYYFYNWVFTPLICNTARIPVQVTDPCAINGIHTLFADNHLDIFPNPNNGIFTLEFAVQKTDNYVIKIINTIGQSVYTEKLDGFNGTYSNKIDLSAFSKGVYMLSISDSERKTVKRVMVY